MENQLIKIGKDKRNLYLKGEGRVEEGGKESTDPNSWESLSQSDQMKRGRAHQEKSTKLRSPLFFINPFRISVRNLAKDIDETQLKKLVATGIQRGLETNLVSKEDTIAHWRAGGDLTSRDIIQKLKAGESGDDDNDAVIPNYDEKDGFKKYIPSVFIDRDFQAIDGKASKTVAPSRGFGFAEFTHHAHALACLRELNNNVAYSAEFVAGGKKAAGMKKQASNRTNNKKKKIESDMEEGFIDEDGKVRIPRLIVEFTVENKAKARKQAERKAQQLTNSVKQKNAAKGEKKPRKKSRGAQQREKKRKMREEAAKEKEAGGDIPSEKSEKKKQRRGEKEDVKQKEISQKPKGIKPPKKKKKVDKDESAFEDMVQSYKKAFAGSDAKMDSTSEETNERTEISKKRWYD